MYVCGCVCIEPEFGGIFKNDNANVKQHLLINCHKFPKHVTYKYSVWLGNVSSLDCPTLQ